MMSLGIRSGVHWMREKDPVIAEARALAAVVLARPGTDSSSTCPPAARAVSNVTRRFSCPTTRDPNTEAMVFTTWAERSRSAGVIAALRGEKSPGRPCGPARPAAGAEGAAVGALAAAGAPDCPGCGIGGWVMFCGAPLGCSHH